MTGTLPRFLARFVLVVLTCCSIQALLWLAVGRASFPGAVADDICSVASSELVVSEQSLSPLRWRDSTVLIEALSQKTRVWDKDEVPREYYEQYGEDSEFDRVYSKGKRLSFGEISSAPLIGKASFGLSVSNMAGKSYEKKWLFVFGAWVELGAHEVTSRS